MCKNQYHIALPNIKDSNLNTLQLHHPNYSLDEGNQKTILEVMRSFKIINTICKMRWKYCFLYGINASADRYPESRHEWAFPLEGKREVTNQSPSELPIRRRTMSRFCEFVRILQI